MMNRGAINGNGNGNGNGDLIIRRLEEPFKKSKRQNVNKLKREKKKQMAKQAKMFRKRSAHGINSFFIDQSDGEDDDDDEDAMIDGDEETDEPDETTFYLSVPPNVCNICGEIFNSVDGRRVHITTSTSTKHQGKHYDFECPHPKCGCYYASSTDLIIHQDFAHSSA